MNKIIQCPSCNTKFALNANQLSGIESPKFHCSRCNTIFSISNEESPPINLDTPSVENPDSNNKSIHSNSSNEYFEQSKISDEETQEDDLFEDKTTDEYEEEIFNDQIEVDSNQYVDEENDYQSNQALPNINDNKIKISRSSNESQLPLNYDSEEEEDSLEDIKIDWPDGNDNKNYEVDLSSTKSINISDLNKSETFNRPSTTHETPRSLLTGLLDENTEIPEVKRDPSLSSLFRDSDKPRKSLSQDISQDNLTQDENSFKNKKNTWLLGEETNQTNTTEFTLPEKIDIKTNSEVSLLDEKNSIEKDSLANLISDLPEETGSENRSFKQTTVMKRNEVLLQSIPDEEDEINEASKTKYTPNHKPKKRFKLPLKPSYSSENLNPTNIIPTKINPIKGYIQAWSIPSIMLLILLTFSNTIASSNYRDRPSFTKSVIKTLKLDSLPSDLLPPRSLSITEPKGSIIKLTSGDKIVLTRGKIQNSSSKDFSNIKIEARAYDKNNISVAKRIIPIPNMLDHSLIQDKIIGDIDRLQNTLRYDQPFVKSKTIEPFAVAIDISDFTQDLTPVFYGVRVYSVGK